MALQLVLIGLLIVGSAGKAIELMVRRHERRATSLLAGCFALLAIGQVLSIPQIGNALDEGLGGGVGKLIYNAATILGLYTLLLFFLRAIHGEQVQRGLRRESLLVTAAIAALVVLMIVTPSGFRAHTLSSPFLGYPTVAAFYLAGGAYFVYAYLAVARLIWVYVRVGRGALVWALRLIAVGLVGLTFTALVRIARVLEVSFGGSLLPVLNTINLRVSLLSYLLVSLGLVVAGWWQGLQLWRRWQTRRQQYLALEPLWLFISSVYPEIVLPESPSGEQPSWYESARWNQQLYRRVLECRDGLLRLGPAIATSAGTTDLSDASPGAVAAYLREAGRSPRGPASGDPLVGPVVLAPPNAAGIGGDVDVLIAISAAMGKEPAA